MSCGRRYKIYKVTFWNISSCHELVFSIDGECFHAYHTRKRERGWSSQTLVCRDLFLAWKHLILLVHKRSQVTWGKPVRRRTGWTNWDWEVIKTSNIFSEVVIR